jgi:hypothetical protein
MNCKVELVVFEQGFNSKAASSYEAALLWTEAPKSHETAIGQKY